MDHAVELEVLGPWSLATSRRFWQDFTPWPLRSSPGAGLRTAFTADADGRRVSAVVEQRGGGASLHLAGPGDLEAAAAQLARALSLDVDARAWPDVGARDPVIGAAQALLPGLRPCGFHSPYEAAVWAVLCQRTAISQAARTRAAIVRDHGDDGVFPAPAVLRGLELDLRGRQAEYLHAVAGAALEGVLDGAALRAADPVDALAAVRQVHGLGPFAAELVLLRGAGAPDVLPLRESTMQAEVEEQYGAERSLQEVSEQWRPYRTWASLHLRVAGERRSDVPATA